MHFSYRLLLRAQITALIVSFACLLLYPVNFKPKAQLSGLYMAAARLTPYYMPNKGLQLFSYLNYRISWLSKVLFREVYDYSCLPMA